jgi:hypothetical protein
MANSTFSGPVRSQNGFQELVDGVWTPLGGGGGGNVQGYTIVNSTPQDSVVIELPDGELGRTFTIAFDNGAIYNMPIFTVGGVPLDMNYYPYVYGTVWNNATNAMYDVNTESWPTFQNLINNNGNNSTYGHLTFTVVQNQFVMGSQDVKLFCSGWVRQV